GRRRGRGGCWGCRRRRRCGRRGAGGGARRRGAAAVGQDHHGLRRDRDRTAGEAAGRDRRVGAVVGVLGLRRAGDPEAGGADRGGTGGVGIGQQDRVLPARQVGVVAVDVGCRDRQRADLGTLDRQLGRQQVAVVRRVRGVHRGLAAAGGGEHAEVGGGGAVVVHVP